MSIVENKQAEQMVKRQAMIEQAQKVKEAQRFADMREIIKSLQTGEPLSLSASRTYANSLARGPVPINNDPAPRPSDPVIDNMYRAMEEENRNGRDVNWVREK